MQDEIDDRGGTGGAERGGSTLREALRRARVDAAERSDVVIDLRQAEIARLDILREALGPVFADVPPEIDLFDLGLVAGDRPRLFVDMVAFVEMGRDRRTYRFMRDGRNGRALIVESEKTEPVVAAVTFYVAHRLVERERLLADEYDHDRPPATPAVSTKAAPAEAVPAVEPEPKPRSTVAPEAAAAPRRRGRWARVLAVVVAFGLGGGLGAAVIVALMIAAANGLLPGPG